MEQFLIISHVICGGTVVLLGLIQMLNRKGGKNHVIIGKVYVAAMWWICLSALSIISFYRFSAFLMVIAVLTFHSSFVGVRVVKRKNPGSEEWYDWVVAVATSLFGIGLVGYGIYAYFAASQPILALLCVGFGILTLKNGTDDLRFFIKPNISEKNWWLYQHIGAMGGSYIAALTAFAVQNPNIFMPNSSMQWLLWIIPGVIGTPIITLATRSWRKKLSKGDATV
ncbi:hypothetical protein [Ekhidna sp. To15]|uniref:hypothetical protein n=1 Tax=Ekhidna sp. To15 TaxID=3395267 RepID=UPI003F51C06E